MSEVTRLIDAAAGGDQRAASELLPLVYAELRKLAAARMAGEQPGQTLDATALVHEAYLRLVDSEGQARYEGKPHFFAAAAEAMRRILIDQARRKRRVRHGGGRDRVDLDQMNVAAERTAEDLIAIDDALRNLSVEEPVAAKVVELRYFAGLTAQEAAEALGISLRTANRHWAYAKAWLYQRLNAPEGAK
jgi:RNA polymerase sigma factor (TIGR02999 family)